MAASKDGVVPQFFATILTFVASSLMIQAGKA